MNRLNSLRKYANPGVTYASHFGVINVNNFKDWFQDRNLFLISLIYSTIEMPLIYFIYFQLTFEAIIWIKNYLIIDFSFQHILENNFLFNWNNYTIFHQSVKAKLIINLIAIIIRFETNSNLVVIKALKANLFVGSIGLGIGFCLS